MLQDRQVPPRISVRRHNTPFTRDFNHLGAFHCSSTGKSATFEEFWGQRRFCRPPAGRSVSRPFVIAVSEVIANGKNGREAAQFAPLARLVLRPMRAW